MNLRWQLTRAGMAVAAGRANADPARYRRLLIGMIVGAAPHLGVATLILVTYFTATDGEGRELSTIFALLELLLVPVAIVLALVLAIFRKARWWAAGLAGGVVLGLAIVVLVVMWHGSVTNRYS